MAPKPERRRISVGRVELRAIEPGDVPAVQALIESDPGYTERVTGYPPGPADAQSLLMMRPEGLPEDAKVVLGAWTDDGLVALVDLLRGYPETGTVFIGLLQVHGTHQRRGLGASTYKSVEEYVRGWPEVIKLRLAVVDTNADAAKFWTAMGFAATGEARPYRYDKLESVARLYEKDIGCWHHPDVEVRPSQIAGRGLFATAAIPEGTVVARLGGRLVSGAELAALLEEAGRRQQPVDTITVGDDLHLVLPDDPRPAIGYGNHSCEPNLWWADAVTLTARRDIAEGEELTSDYGTSSAIEDFEMPCRCRSALCRGVITGRDWRIADLRERYGGHWIPLLRDRISAEV